MKFDFHRPLTDDRFAKTGQTEATDGNVARLKDGVPVEQANADIASIAAALRQEHAEQSLDAHPRAFIARRRAGEIKPYVYLVAGAAAVRLALGSGTWPLVWQLLAEALVLSAAGVAAGAALAYAATRTFLALLPVDVPGWMRLELDYRVLGFAVAAAAGTAALAMLLPAAHRLRTNLNDVLKHGARGSSSGHTAAAWVRRALVVAEVALSLVLLVGAGLGSRKDS